MRTKLSEFSSAVLSKAQGLIRTDQVRRDVKDRYVYWVKKYRVAIITDGNEEWLTCTCKHGLNNPGKVRCSHAAAVLALMESMDNLRERKEAEDEHGSSSETEEDAEGSG